MSVQPLIIPSIWFFKPRGFVGYATSFFTCGRYSHCGFSHSIEGVPVFTDATIQYGVGCRSLKLTDRADAVVWLPRVPMSWLTARIAGRLGRPYGIMDALGVVVGGMRDHKGMICTQLVLDVLADAVATGIRIPGDAKALNLPRDSTSPSKLLEALS